MSMLVRKGTMLHRNSTRRPRRPPPTSGSGPSQFHGRQRSASLVPTSGNVPFQPIATANVRKASLVSSDAIVVRHSNVPPLSPRRDPNCGSAPPTGSASAKTCSEQRRSSTITVSTNDRQQLHSVSLGPKDERQQNLSVTEYGSLTFQLTEAAQHTDGLCKFVWKAMQIVSNTAIVSVFLACLLLLPLLMVIVGVQRLQDCPLEPHIPLYLAVGGSFGLVKTSSLLWRQTRSRRCERATENNSFAAGSGIFDDIASTKSAKITEAALSIFLIGWFAAGNYWVLRIYPPTFDMRPPETVNYCDKFVYVFAVTQLIVCYAVASGIVVLAIVLAVARLQRCI